MAKRKVNGLADFWCGSALDEYNENVPGLSDKEYRSFEQSKRVRPCESNQSPSAGTNTRQQRPPPRASKADSQILREHNREQQQQQQIEQQGQQKQQEKQQQLQQRGRTVSLSRAESLVTARLAEKAARARLSAASVSARTAAVDATRCLSSQAAAVLNMTRLKDSTKFKLAYAARTKLVAKNARDEEARQRGAISALEEQAGQAFESLHTSLTNTEAGRVKLAGRVVPAIERAEEHLIFIKSKAAEGRQNLVKKYQSVKARFPDVGAHIESIAPRENLPELPIETRSMLSKLSPNDVQAARDTGMATMEAMATATELAVEAGEQAFEPHQATAPAPNAFAASVLAVHHRQAALQAIKLAAMRRQKFALQEKTDASLRQVDEAAARRLEALGALKASRRGHAVARETVAAAEAEYDRAKQAALVAEGLSVIAEDKVKSFNEPMRFTTAWQTTTDAEKNRAEKVWRAARSVVSCLEEGDDDDDDDGVL